MKSENDYSPFLFFIMLFVMVAALEQCSISHELEDIRYELHQMNMRP